VFFSESENNHPLASDVIPLPHKMWLMVDHHPVATIKIYGMGSTGLWGPGRLCHAIMVVLVCCVHVMLFGSVVLMRDGSLLGFCDIKLRC